MRPNDKNGLKPTSERPFRVLIISGSNRREYNCPGVDSKSRMLMLRMAELMPSEWEVDYEDLGNVYARARIQSCNACVSTSMALCVWPCNCYAKDDKKEPDLMWDLDMYARLDLADAWAIIGPVNWYSPSSNLKLMFDRLVCMNGGNPREDLIEHKNPEKAMALERSAEWKELRQNHLEGRSAGFFCYGDGGGDELDDSGRPLILRHKEWFDTQKEPFEEMRQAYGPLVWQCRYAGIEVPDKLWDYCESGQGVPYSENQAEDIVQRPENAAFLGAFEAWVSRFVDFADKKGKVEPGVYRAFGYEPPNHRWADVKLKWRQIRMSAAHPVEPSSPAQQEKLGLNDDATFHPARSEGQKLRDE